MTFYRKIPVTIEARRHLEVGDIIGDFGDYLDAGFELSDWCGGEFDVLDKTITIPTLEGDMKASPGDYIIKGVNGEFYPCKPDIFAKTYEEVLEDTDQT